MKRSSSASLIWLLPMKLRINGERDVSCVNSKNGGICMHDLILAHSLLLPLDFESANANFWYSFISNVKYVRRTSKDRQYCNVFFETGNSSRVMKRYVIKVTFVWSRLKSKYLRKTCTEYEKYFMFFITFLFVPIYIYQVPLDREQMSWNVYLKVT